MINRKLDIVLGLQKYLPLEHRQTNEQAMTTWWANIRPEGGMRLTHHGYEILHKVLKMESWSLDITNGDQTGAWRSRINKRVILDLDRKLQWPYYLDFNAKKKTGRIVFFGSREAMMATMYGDLEQWLENLRRN